MGIQSKSGKTETAVVGAVVAAVCIVIYLGALVQAAVRFYMSIEDRNITAEQEFAEIVDLALTEGKRGFMDERFIETMNYALASKKSIEALIISGPDGEYAFERQKGYAVNWVNNSPRFINRLGFSNKNLNRPLSINNLRNVNIMAVARAFDYIELSGILKETLLIILIGFAVAFFTMLLQLLAGTGVGKQNETPAQATANVNIRAPSREPARETFSAIRDVNKNIEERSIVSGTRGLYSPRSNIGWEENTKDRLDLELHRCASTEKDLTLIYMYFTDITNNDMYSQAAEEIVSSFASRDMLFEYDRYGICAILPGINLETGISRAQELYMRIMDKFPSSDRYSSLCIGISSRSGRLLNADRLMMEAQEALNRAMKDKKSSIVAFKSDLDKYRAFIVSQNVKRP